MKHKFTLESPFKEGQTVFFLKNKIYSGKITGIDVSATFRKKVKPDICWYYYLEYVDQNGCKEEVLLKENAIFATKEKLIESISV